jgi:putative transposase
MQMKGTKFTEEQMIKILKQAESGVPVKELSRQHAITIQTIYKWKRKFGGMEVNDAKKLRALEDENRRLKKLVAEQALDIQILKDVNSKKW